MSRDRWLLIAGSSRGAAEHYAADRGIRAAMVLSRRDLLTRPDRLRARIRAAGVSAAAVHSLDWRRERTPQLAELALGLAPVGKRVLFDEAGEEEATRGRFLAPRIAAALPFEALLAGAAATRTALRPLGRRSGAPTPLLGPGGAARVLAIWPGSSQVGGGVTHMSGILAGFKQRGLRVGLVSAGPVAEQLAAVADDIEVADPPSRLARISVDTELLATDAALLDAARRLAARLEADFVYQRHGALLTVGARLASERGRPLALEWNSSAAWLRRNWDRPAVRLPPAEWLVRSLELKVLRSASVVAAVSSHAAEMALAGGAVAGSVGVMPNAVDLGPVERAIAKAGPPTRAGCLTVGWIGSFGPWHGAPVLVRALRRLPAEVRVRMIGDGAERPSVQALAAELGVVDRIEWTGALPHDRALAALAACDVLASPHVPLADTPFFGSPTKLFEYMALGRPIVASRLEQLGEVLEHEHTALLTEPGDERGLAAAIERLAAAPELGQRLGCAARREAGESHTWERRAEDILATLEGRP